MTSAFSSISNVDVCKGVTFFPFDGLREKLGECFREEVRSEMRNVHRARHLCSCIHLRRLRPVRW